MELNSSVCYFDSLPDEICLNVFRNLTHNELGRIARVCRRWNALTKTPLLWKKVDVELYEPCGSQNKAARNLVAKLPTCATHIKLDFRHPYDWTELLNFKELCVRLKRCPHLQMLFLRASKLSDNLESVIDLCTQFLPSVKILVFHYSVFPPHPTKKKCRKISKIEILDLNFCDLGPFNKPPFLRMKSLRKLRLGLTFVTHHWFKDVTFRHNPLEVLDLGQTGNDSRPFRTIQSYRLRLKELYICGSSVEDDDLHFSNFVFPYLQKMCLDGCYNVTCEGIISVIQSCPSLQLIYVDERVFQSCIAHPFIVKNKCKLEIIKPGHCYNHRKVDYLCEL